MECLMVLAIFALLFNFAVSSWQPFFKSRRGQSNLAELERALRFAQQEALLRGQIVTLCPSRDQLTCSGAWRDGILIEAFDAAGEPNRLRVIQLHSGGGELHWRAFPRHLAHCQFLPNGMTPHQNGTFWYCEAGQASWALLLGQAGRFRIQFPNREGRLQDERGLNLPC